MGSPWQPSVLPLPSLNYLGPLGATGVYPGEAIRQGLGMPVKSSFGNIMSRGLSLPVCLRSFDPLRSFDVHSFIYSFVHASITQSSQPGTVCGRVGGRQALSPFSTVLSLAQNTDCGGEPLFELARPCL